MLELSALIGSAGVAMRVDMDHADGLLAASRLQDRLRMEWSPPTDKGTTPAATTFV